MKNYHRRVVVLHYSDDDLPRFEEGMSVDDWHRAVGRMVTYSMHNNEGPDNIEMVVGSFSQNPTELCCAYYPRLPAAEPDAVEPQFNVRTQASRELEDSTERLLGRAALLGRPFVVGAVLHSDGHYGFHS